jgi:hypothetical protein
MSFPREAACAWRRSPIDCVDDRNGIVGKLANVRSWGYTFIGCGRSIPVRGGIGSANAGGPADEQQ